MTEFIAYYESSVGTYMPVIVVYKSDGSQEFKELTKSDLERLPDAFDNGNGDELMGGWLYKNSGKVGIRDNWQRRYAVFRGPYLFLFQNPKSQTVVGVVPLENCDVYTPGGGVKSFSDSHVARGGKDSGYEFEIRHSSRNKVHFSASTEEERDRWADATQERSGQVNGVSVKDSHKPLSSQNGWGGNVGGSGMQNISVTRTRLDSVQLHPQHHSQQQQQQQWGSSYHREDDEMDDEYSGVTDGIFSPPPPPSGGHNYHSSSGQQTIFGGSAALQGGGRGQHTQGQQIEQQYQHQQQHQQQQQHQHQQHQQHQQQSHQPQQSVEEALAQSRERDEEMKSRARAERQQLTLDLEEKMRFQQEGRKREAEARERSHNKARIELARLQEAKNPMTLAEMFRFLLSFANEDLCEEADPDSPLQFPHLKGHWAENMLSNIYRIYCKTSGFMSLEEFVEFLEDTAVLRTHVPHDELDEPLREFQSQLDPVVLLSTVPRNLGCSEEVDTVISGAAGAGTVTSDNFRLNFAQFYQILLRITHVVYADLYAKAPAHAFNKFLQESILPLSCWSKGHHKRGSTDTLVTDERIVLLLMTYAPNLWRVFLAYAQDCHAKVPAISSSPYPHTAKQSEKKLFGIPTGAPNEQHAQVVGGADGKHEAEGTVAGIFMTESSCLKFCQDYGLMPHLMSRTVVKDCIFALNRPKTLAARQKPRAPQAPTVFFQKTQASVIREHLGETMRVHHAAAGVPMQFSDSGGGRRRPSQSRHLPQHLTNPTFTLEVTGGLGFSEFVELVARVALEGMEAPAYHVLFPTPFSKVLGVLSVWGVADLKKLEEVRLLNSIE